MFTLFHRLSLSFVSTAEQAELEWARAPLKGEVSNRMVDQIGEHGSLAEHNMEEGGNEEGGNM